MAVQAKDRLGRRGERIACRYLRWRKGYRILDRNWRFPPMGELDIVALDGQTLVFVEVKTRRADSLAVPEDAITPDKARRLRSLADCFVSRHGFGHLPCRCDIVAVTVRPWPRPSRIAHYADAL
jgi:putative endonuclease